MSRVIGTECLLESVVVVADYDATAKIGCRDRAEE